MAQDGGVVMSPVEGIRSDRQRKNVCRWGRPQKFVSLDREDSFLFDENSLEVLGEAASDPTGGRRWKRKDWSIY